MKQTIGFLAGIYNEANRVVDCLNWHLPYVDEAVIVIQQSEDGTEKVVDDYIAQSPYKDKIKVLHFPKMGCSEATLQHGADALNTDWVLYIDADEKFPEEFLKQMHTIVENAKVDGFWFERDNWFDVPIYNEAVPIEPKNLKVKHPASDKQLRLTRKSMTWFPPQIHVRARVRGPLGNDHDEKMDTLDFHIYHLKSLKEQWTDNRDYLPAVRIVNAMEMTKHQELIKIPHVETTGMLYFAELFKHIPFEIKRFFTIMNVPSGAERGGHANRVVHEVLFCLKGSVKVELDDGMKKRAFTLNDPCEGLFIKNKTWIRMFDFTSDCILLCVASDFYHPEERIATYEEFKKITMPNNP